jgi:hypothetical protein
VLLLRSSYKSRLGHRTESVHGTAGGRGRSKDDAGGRPPVKTGVATRTRGSTRIGEEGGGPTRERSGDQDLRSASGSSFAADVSQCFSGHTC